MNKHKWYDYAKSLVNSHIAEDPDTISAHYQLLKNEVRLIEIVSWGDIGKFNIYRYKAEDGLPQVSIVILGPKDFIAFKNNKLRRPYWLAKNFKRM